MVWRLFERLQQRIKGISREAVHFIYNVDFVTALAGGKGDLLSQLAHVVNAGVAGCVYLNQVEEAAFVDSRANSTSIAGALINVGVRAVHCFSQQPSAGRFACPTRAAEQIGVADAASFERVLQRADDVLLADYLIESSRSPFQVERLFRQVGIPRQALMSAVTDVDQSIIPYTHRQPAGGATA